MDKKIIVALAGVIVAALSTELNDAVSNILLGDISGAIGMGHDSSTWFESLYISAQIFGMAVSPWFSVTLTLRRWLLFVITLTCVSTLLIPTTSNLTLLFGLRIVQGLCGGLTIPLLMSTALRALPPPIRLYGLAAYALTATFFPNLATAFAAVWMQGGDGSLGWQFAFYQAVPLGALAGLLVWYGMPQDPPHYERFAKFDWRGALLVLVGLGSFSTMLEQGDRYDWFNSNTICVLALISVVSIPLLLVNEWFHELPLFKLQMLARRNLAYGMFTLFMFLIISLSASTLPGRYLQEVQGYRPLQSYVLTSEIAASQLVLLPLMALVLNVKWVDARVVSFIGLSCILAACIGSSFLNSEWQRDQFYLWQGFQSVGEAMVVMPLLMMATNSVVPQEGPFASSLVNTPRAISAAVGVWLLELIQRWRGALHSNRLADQAGQDRTRLLQGNGNGHDTPPPLLPNGRPRSVDSLEQFRQAIEHQATVLTLSDGFLLLAAITVFMMVVLFILPVRTYPPRIVFAEK